MGKDETRGKDLCRCCSVMRTAWLAAATQGNVLCETAWLAAATQGNVLCETAYKGFVFMTRYHILC